MTTIRMSIQYGFMDIMGNMDKMVGVVHNGPPILQGYTEGLAKILDNYMFMCI